MYLSLQGNVGQGKAIEYFTSIRSPVSIPLNDTQKYDLVVDMDGKLKRISVKTTTRVLNGSYRVMQKNSGGASQKKMIRPFDNSACDFVFILTGDGTMYLIPSIDIQVKNELALNERYDKYIVHSRGLEDFMEA